MPLPWSKTPVVFPKKVNWYLCIFPKVIVISKRGKERGKERGKNLRNKYVIFVACCHLTLLTYLLSNETDRLLAT